MYSPNASICSNPARSYTRTAGFRYSGGLEQQALHAQRSRLGLEHVDEDGADLAAAGLRPHVHPLQLRLVSAQLAHRAAADRLALEPQDDERAVAGSHIVSRESPEVVSLGMRRHDVGVQLLDELRRHWIVDRRPFDQECGLDMART